MITESWWWSSEGDYRKVSRLDPKALAKVIDYLLKELMRRKFDQKVRIDGRKPDEIRKITVETSTLPRTHGSAVFKEEIRRFFQL